MGYWSKLYRFIASKVPILGMYLGFSGVTTYDIKSYCDEIDEMEKFRI